MRIRLMCVLTVDSSTTRAEAISVLERPPATCSSTSRSRGVSSSRRPSVAALRRRRSSDTAPTAHARTQCGPCPATKAGSTSLARHSFQVCRVSCSRSCSRSRSLRVGGHLCTAFGVTFGSLLLASAAKPSRTPCAPTAANAEGWQNRGSAPNPSFDTLQPQGQRLGSSCSSVICDL